MFKPVEVKALPGYKLWLRYADGAEGEVDLSDLAGKGVFKIWDDPRVFEQVRLDEGGAIAWGEEVELCPDALYLRLTGKTPEEASPHLREDRNTKSTSAKPLSGAERFSQGAHGSVGESSPARRERGSRSAFSIHRRLGHAGRGGGFNSRDRVVKRTRI